MQNRYTIPLLCAAAIIYACGPWRHESNDAASAERHPVKRGASQNVVATTFDVNSRGDRVDFILSIANNTKKAIELKFPTSQTHDFAVLDTQGRTVWRWSQGRMFTQAMQSKVVKSKDTLTISNDWDARNAHGEYVAIATLITDNHAVEKRVAFRLP